MTNSHACLLVFLMSVAVFAQSPGPSTSAGLPFQAKVAVINIQSAIMASNEGRKEFEALDKSFEPKRSEIKSLADEIDRLRKQMDAQGSVMSDEARASLARQVDTKQRTLARAQEDAQNDFGGQENEIAQRILKKLLPVVDKYAKENSLALIVDKSKSWPDWPLLWASPSVDITKTVVDIYNAQAINPVGANHQAPAGKIAPSVPKAQPLPSNK